MTTIKATCPSCGEVCLTPDDIELRVDPDGVLDDYYAFLCSDCLQVIRKPADDRIVRLLASGGVPVLEHDERRQPRPRFEGPQLTHDDLLDFHTLLAGDGWFDELEGLVRG
ncbi:MAG: hypothetical protein ACR2MA_09605 [Egibacteraceae bacterium]